MKKVITLLALLFVAFVGEAKFTTDTPSVNCYPNPFSHQFTLAIESVQAQSVTIQVVNSVGVNIHIDTVSIGKGLINMSYAMPNQPAGIYYILVRGQNWSRNQRVVYMKQAPSRSDSIDIVHYDISLFIQNLASKTISGTTVVTIDPKQVDSITTIKLDLLKLNVTKVKVNSVTASFYQNDSELYVVINRKKGIGSDSLIDVAITYNGQPVSDPQWGGFYFSGNYAYNMGVAFKSLPHNFGRCWFPCIDNFTDRSTYTFHITTDPTFKAVCNGLMLPEVTNGDGSITWHWDLKQPIPTYLASVAVGKYEFIKYDFQGINRTYPVWLAVVAADTTKAKTSFAKLNNALQCFESKYGAYPFDRIGYVGVPFSSGAMEHATNIAYPNYAINGGTDYETLFAHELSHMWWGDLATCRTAEDMWLNEGWTSFNEALFLECVYGKAAYLSDIKDKSIEVLHNAPRTDGGWYPVSGIPQNITYGTHVYKKGALMVHTLRTLMGDAAFFAACKSYLAKYYFADVSSDDLKNEFQKFTPANLTDFFQKWIYSAGHSDIVLSKQVQTGNELHLEFAERNRLNTLSSSLSFEVRVSFSNQTSTLVYLPLISGQASFDTILPAGVSFTDCSVNPSHAIQLANVSQTQVISKTGTIAFADALFSVNVQTVGSTSSESVTATHHWVGPIAENVRNLGIRPSSERYWSVGGGFTTGLKTWAFFTYDGNVSSYLDSELINKTEDSLVLLYRANVNADWQIHTDNTFQPGTSKTDKTGRFWVNELKAGDYAFGMRDASVVGIKEILPSNKKQQLFTAIPNPAYNALLLQFKENVYVKTVHIYSLQGAKLKSFTINNEVLSLPVDISSLLPDHYIIVAELNNTSISQKFIKLDHR